jgi:hypothetical protein
MQEQKKSIVLKQITMETRVFEAVWSHVSLFGKQLITSILSRLQKVTTTNEREQLLKMIKSIIIIDNPQLENSDSLNEFFDALQSMTRFQVAQLFDIQPVLLNAPIELFSALSASNYLNLTLDSSL